MAIDKDNESETGAPVRPDPRPDSADSDPPENDRASDDQDAGTDSESDPNEPVQAEPARPMSAVAAPVRASFWMAPAYVGGLILIFIAERILSGYPAWHWLVAGVGLFLVIAATAARFSPQFGAVRRTEIERVLPLLSVLGVIALAIYGATSEWGAPKLGFDKLTPDTRERVLGVLNVLWMTLLGIAVVPMLFAEAALFPMRQAERPENRRVHAAAAAGLTLVLAAAYGALFVFAADGLQWKVDYSYFKTSEPSESTRNVAKTLKDPLKVTAYYPQVNEVRPEVERYLRGLAAGNPKLQVEVKDRLLVPKQAREQHVTQDGVIVLSRGTTMERLDVGADLETARAKLRTLDRDFQERLMKMVRSRRVAYLTVGHGEVNERINRDPEGRSGQLVKLLLEKQNYQVKDLGLAQGLGSEVPDDAGIVMVLGPTEPVSAEEIKSLERYAQAGGHLLLALDPDAISVNTDTVTAPAAETAKPTAPKPTPKAPASASAATPPSPPPAPPQPPAEPGSVRASLEALGRLAGVDFSSNVLANDRQHVRRRYNNSDRTILPTNRFSSHASVSTLSRNSAQSSVVVLGAGSLEPQKGGPGKVDVTLRSLPNTFSDANRNYEADADEKRTTFNLAAAVSRPITKPGAAAPEPPKSDKDKNDKKDKAKPEDKAKAGPDEMRAFVIADSDVFSDVALSNAVLNQLLFVDAVRWLGGEESFAGAVNTEEDKHIEHTKQQDLVWFYGTIFGAPALVLGLGLLYSRHARRPRGGRR